MLECRGLSVSYGPHRALEDVAIQVGPDEIVVILGANGAGKSTLLKAVAGLVPSSASSQTTMNGQSIKHLPPHRIVEAGVALVPEGRGLFGELTVEENLLLGAYAQRARESEKEHLQSVFNLFPILAERRGQTTHTMSGGEQQMVAIGRAIMSSPAILMLDEPSLGLSPLLCKDLFKTFAEIRGAGVGILLVEQNAQLGLAIADRGYVLETGRIVAEDSAERLARDPAVREAYLGGPGKAGPEPLGDVPPSGPMRGIFPKAPPTVSTAPPTIVTDREAPFGPGRGTLTEEYVIGTIADMVNRASAIQLDHVERVRSERPDAPPESPPEARPDLPPRVLTGTQTGAGPLETLFPKIRSQKAQPLAEMVDRAAAIQAGHVESVRAARSGVRLFPKTSGRAGSALDEALANIEAAAHNARNDRGGTTQGAGGGPAFNGIPPAGEEAKTFDRTGAAGVLPVIEVYKKPRLEIYRRSGDGKEKVLIKGDKSDEGL